MVIPDHLSFAVSGLIFSALILIIGDNPVLWTGLFLSVIMMVFTFVIAIPDGWE